MIFSEDEGSVLGLVQLFIITEELQLNSFAELATSYFKKIIHEVYKKKFRYGYVYMLVALLAFLGGADGKSAKNVECARG